ncbi:glycosyltransferase family 2 protein [Marinobacter nauticus]|nr:glycosyltransferase [Marinobacter nauticus]
MYVKDWQASETTKPLVSISCTTYNHEKYIAKCLEGFLMQKTTFPVEILIYDDASTDSNPKIIKSYQRKYPNLIKVILQKENQFRQGHNVNKFNFNRAQGKFIALCHGDDYWLDPFKLETQVELLEKFDAGIVGHPAKMVDVNNKEIGKLSGKVVSQTCKYSIKELLEHGGHMLPFGSIMIDRKAMLDLVEYMPPVKYHTGIQLLGCRRNGIVVSPKVMSAYRIQVPGSTTELMLLDNKKKVLTTIERIESLKALRGLYPEKYRRYFGKAISDQFATWYSFRFPLYGVRILGAIVKNESLFYSITLMFRAFLSSGKKAFKKF